MELLYIVVEEKDRTAIAKLAEYAEKQHADWEKFLGASAPKLTEAIREQTDSPENLYGSLYAEMVVPVVEAVRKRRMEGAYQLYKSRMLRLIDKYLPDLPKDTFPVEGKEEE